MTRSELMKQIQATDFALYDAQLFLDSHPDNAQALAFFHKNQEISRELRQKYTEIFGPLTADSVTNQNYWDWIKEPWPWEKGE